MQTYTSDVSMQSYGCPLNAIQYMNCTFNANNCMSEELSHIRPSLVDNKCMTSVPLITSQMPSSQWLINPFYSSAPLMTTNPEMASLLSSNYLITNSNASHLPSLPLRTSFDNTNDTNKEVINFKNCSLYPPKTNPKITTRERPLGCRTVFVGGLPENITEDIIKEIFNQNCGEICAIRISKKNFCHIRFESENSVDLAIGLSGYRLKIKDLDDVANTGRLHVDFAQARDDLYEWECKQRSLQREMRHREQLEYNRFCPPSPPSVDHYSDHEAIELIDKLKNDQSFTQAVHVLINWLERGECQKRNCSQFYTMIQTTNNHIKRLQNERNVAENDWLTARQSYHSTNQSILLQFNQIEKIFEAAMRQKAWDHFTKAQRKHIDAWFRQTKEMKNQQIEDVVNKREEDEMDLSDGDDDANEINKVITQTNVVRNTSTSTSEMNLRDENDVLLCQIESFRNEAVFVREESRQEKEYLEKQLIVLKQTLQGMQHQLIALTKQKSGQQSLLQETHKNTNDYNNKDNIHNSDNRALLISLISIYLNIHPFGTNSEDITTYLSQQSYIRDSTLLSTTFIDSFLLQYPQLFTQLESDSNGKKLWRFCAFQTQLF